jgi:hypothetical protein
MSGGALSVTEPGFAGWIGVAREDITPLAGIFARSWGAAQHDVAEGIHRPLTATALTLRARQDATPLALIALDLGWWRTHDDEWFLRGGLIDALGLDPAHVVIALSHTHAGPSICREDADKPGGHLIAPYLEGVRDRVVAATRRALQTETRATLVWKQGRCGLAQNRDLPDPERPRLLCGFHPFASGDARQPAPDDALLVGRVTSDEDGGKVLATLVNYACHPTVLAWQNRLISPDYVGALREVVEQDTGGAPCLFLQGASGELAAREQYTADTALVDRHGEQVGYAALAVLRDMLPPSTRLEYEGVMESGAPLAIWKHVTHASSSDIAAGRIGVRLALKPGPTVEEVQARLRELQRSGSDPVQAERLLRRRRIMQSTGPGPTTDMPLWAWRLGDALLVAQPNEAYSWLQMQLRARFAPRPVIVVNIANGPYCGYLPPAELYGQDLYPVWQTPFDRDCLEHTCAVAITALTALLSPSRDRN